MKGYILLQNNLLLINAQCCRKLLIGIVGLFFIGAGVSSAADLGAVIGSTGAGFKYEFQKDLYLDVEGAIFSVKMPNGTNCVSNCSMSAKWVLAGLVKKTDFLNFGIFYNTIKVENCDYDRSMKQSLKSTGSYNPVSLYVGKTFDLDEHLNFEVGLIYLGHPKFSFQPGTNKYTQKQIQYEHDKANRIFGNFRYMPKISLTYQF